MSESDAWDHVAGVKVDLGEGAESDMQAIQRLNRRLDDLHTRLHRVECQAGFVRGFEQHTSPYADRVKVGQRWVMKDDLSEWKWFVEALDGKKCTLFGFIRGRKTILLRTLCKNYRRVS